MSDHIKDGLKFGEAIIAGMGSQPLATLIGALARAFVWAMQRAGVNQMEFSYWLDKFDEAVWREAGFPDPSEEHVPTRPNLPQLPARALEPLLP